MPPPLRFLFCPVCATQCTGDGWCQRCGRITVEFGTAHGEEKVHAGHGEVSRDQPGHWVAAGRGTFVTLRPSVRHAGGTTYGLRGRLVWTAILIAIIPVIWALLGDLGFLPAHFYAATLMPWGLRDVWRRETRLMFIKRP